MAGRKPSSKHLRLIGHGDRSPVAALPAKKPAAAKAAPKPAAGDKVAVPAHLTGVARKEYERVARELGRMNKFSALFREPLAVYAQSVADWIEAERKLKAKGQGKVVTSPKGYPIQNPWLAIRNRAQEQLLKAANDLGLTLTAQVRISNAQLDLFGDNAPARSGAENDNAFAGF